LVNVRKEDDVDRGRRTHRGLLRGRKNRGKTGEARREDEKREITVKGVRGEEKETNTEVTSRQGKG
jgi:hypothetical protein